MPDARYHRTQPERDAMVASVAAGRSMYSVAREHGVSAATVCKACREHGVISRHQFDTLRKTQRVITRKYELTQETVKFCGRTLHRIRALRSFGSVLKGETGGFVDGENRLSHHGLCWIADDALVMDGARVLGDAWVSGTATVSGAAVVRHDAHVTDQAQIEGAAVIDGCAWVYHRARVGGSARVSGCAMVGGIEIVAGCCVVSTHYVPMPAQERRPGRARP